MQINDIKSEKTRLRKEFLQIRNSLPINIKTKSDELILNNLLSLNQYKGADTIFTYVSKDSEVDTMRIIDIALDDNKLIAVPKCKSGCEMDFYYIKSKDELESGAFGVLEPKAGLKKADEATGICLVPGICFDKSGFRLGYGKGYYDRFLPQFNGVTVGLCRSDFLIEQLPYYNTDYKVDIVITDKEIYITD